MSIHAICNEELRWQAEAGALDAFANVCAAASRFPSEFVHVVERVPAIVSTRYFFHSTRVPEPWRQDAYIAWFERHDTTELLRRTCTDRDRFVRAVRRIHRLALRAAARKRS